MSLVFAAGLPPNSPESEEEEEEEEEGEQQTEPMEGPDLEEKDAMGPDEEQPTIPESFQDEACVDVSRRFIRQQQAEIDELFTDLEAEAEGGMEAEEEPQEPELWLPSMYRSPTRRTWASPTTTSSVG